MVTNGAKFSDGDGDVVSALCEVHTEKRQRFSCLLLFLLLLVAFGFWHNIFSIFVVVKTRVICTRVCVCECQCVCVCAPLVPLVMHRLQKLTCRICSLPETLPQKRRRQHTHSDTHTSAHKSRQL